MAIRVAHEPSPSIVGGAALVAGQRARAERDVDRARQDAARRAQLQARREEALARVALRAQENQLRAQEARRRTIARLQEGEADRTFEMQRMERQAELAQETFGYKMTAEQKARQRQLQQGILWVRQNTGPGGRFSAEQGQALEWQMAQQMAGIARPIPQVEEEPEWPQGQDVGEVWMDKTTGAQMTRNEKGIPVTQIEFADTKEGIREKQRQDAQKERQAKAEAEAEAYEQAVEAEREAVLTRAQTLEKEHQAQLDKARVAWDATGTDKPFQGALRSFGQYVTQAQQERLNAGIRPPQRPGAGGGQQGRLPPGMVMNLESGQPVEYNLLPYGTHYVHPDGTTRRKR